VKKRRSQVGELDQLKLKIAVLHSDRDEEVHMTQLVGFITVELVSVDLISMVELFGAHLDELRVA